MEQFEQLEQLIQQRKFVEIRKILIEMNVIDVAEFIKTMPREDALIIFRLLPKDMMADVFSYLDNDQREYIIATISDIEIASFFDDLLPDDAIEFLDEVPANIVKRVRRIVTPENWALLQQFMKYPKDSAGKLMTVDFVELHDRLDVRGAIERVRETGPDKESIYTCYVIDDVHHLVGTIPLHTLVTAPLNALVSEVMDENVISVRATEDQEAVALTMSKYDLVSIPVVDKETRLIGLITIDDMVDVIHQEATEDIEKMAAIVPTGKEYLRTGIFAMAKKRLPWLLLLMFSATITGSIIARYEEILASTVILASFIPMLMNTSGNSGSQSAAMVIRGLALGEITSKDVLRVMAKEIRVAAVCGFVLGIANGLRIMFFMREASIYLNLAVSISIGCTVVLSKIIGSILPLAAKKVGFDPAVMASPLITTIVDATSLLIFFYFSRTLMGL